MLEETKLQGELQRKETDDCNLALQSYLYEKSYYIKEIQDCRNTKTPNLADVGRKASEHAALTGMPEDACLRQLVDIDKAGLTEDAFKELMRYLGRNLEERMKLAEELQQARQAMQTKQQEFHKKRRFL